MNECGDLISGLTIMNYCNILLFPSFFQDINFGSSTVNVKFEKKQMDNIPPLSILFVLRIIIVL